MSVLTLILWAIAAFMAVWVGTISLAGVLGWKPLAARFPAQRWPQGEGVLLTWQSGSVGASNYNGVLNAIVTDEGLYLKPVALFAYNHPPVFIPWAAVEELDKGLFGALKVRFRDGGGLSLRGRVASIVRERYDAWLAAPPARSPEPLLSLDDEEPEALDEAEHDWRRQARQRE